jgi:hypothetical protein
MSREPPLTERDVEFYVSHLPQIEALKDDPSGLQSLIAATGWTEGRLAYVTAKAGLALMGHLDPEGLKAKKFPAFALPTEEETALVLAKEPAIARAFAQISRTRRDKAARAAPARKPSRRRGN